jgi:hypothetical protein
VLVANEKRATAIKWAVKFHYHGLFELKIYKNVDKSYLKICEKSEFYTVKEL